MDQLFLLRQHSVRVYLLLVLLLFSISPSVRGDGVLRDGIGAISTGRGGTNLGFADNGNIIADNPGSLVNIAGSGLDEIGFDLLITDLSYSDPDNPAVGSEDNPFPMGQVSFIRKLGDGNVAVGLGAFSQAGFSANYTMNGPFPFLGPQHYKSVGAMMRILPSASVKLTEQLSVGATLGVAVSHTELEGPYWTQLATPFLGTPTLLDLQGTGAGLSWSLGLQYQLSCCTTLGLSYQAKTEIDQSGSARITIPGLGTSGFDLDMETAWPSILGLGLSHRVNCRTTLGLDVLWTRWSTAKDSYDLTFSNPSNPVFAAVLGPALPERYPLQWRDTVAIRVGVQRQIGRGEVIRAGYVYHRNPIPAETLTPYIQSIVENAVSFGYGINRGQYYFDVAYQYMFGPDQTVGVSGFVGNDFNGSTSSASVHFVMASLVRKF